MVWPFFLMHRWGQWRHFEEFCKVLVMQGLNLGYKLLECGVIKAYLERLSCATHSHTDLVYPHLFLVDSALCFSMFCPTFLHYKPLLSEMAGRQKMMEMSDGDVCFCLSWFLIHLF